LANGFVVFAHASAAAWWVGSLLLLRRACDLVDLANLAQAVRRFSAVAVVIVGVLVFAGVLLIRALLNFEQLPQLSPYELWLATKIGVVAVVLSVAAFNKFRLTPRLMAGDGAATSALRKSINVELVLIGMVIAVTALLTTYTAPPEQSP
jgi:putative copper export protein